MKIITHDGDQILFQSRENKLSFLKVQIASPVGGEYITVPALVDSGATNSVVTTELMERLAMDMAVPFLGTQVSETAGGEVKEPMTKIHLRITGTDKQSTLFLELPVTINEALEYPVIGMDIIQFFRADFTHGRLNYFVFNPDSPAAIQKRIQVEGG